MIITIEGGRSEGKTSMARSICKGRKSVFIEESSLSSPFWEKLVDDSTEFIVVDDIKDYDKVYDIFNNRLLSINKLGKDSININMPDVILVLRSYSGNTL